MGICVTVAMHGLDLHSSSLVLKGPPVKIKWEFLWTSYRRRKAYATWLLCNSKVGSALIRICIIVPRTVTMCGSWGKKMNEEQKCEWIREQVSWLFSYMKFTWSQIHFFQETFFLTSSKAFRCHRVLLKHQKSRRKGHAFTSPSSKASKTLLGSFHCCPI